MRELLSNDNYNPPQRLLGKYYINEWKCLKMSIYICLWITHKYRNILTVYGSAIVSKYLWNVTALLELFISHICTVPGRQSTPERRMSELMLWASVRRGWFLTAWQGDMLERSCGVTVESSVWILPRGGVAETRHGDGSSAHTEPARRNLGQ